jgi:hypothetical protein
MKWLLHCTGRRRDRASHGRGTVNACGVGKICSAAVRLTGMFFRRAPGVHEVRGTLRRRACGAIAFHAACLVAGRLARGLQSYSVVVETKPAAALRHPRRKASACDEAPPFVNYNKEQK